MGLYEDAVARSRRRFVGRDSEVARFKELLDGSRSSVWWVFGPGGIGKSLLLEVLAGEGREAGCRVAVADLRLSTGEGSTGELTTTITSQLGAADPARPPLVVLDALVPTGAIERWLRCELLPFLPSRSLVVVGSRQAPTAEWRSDPVWSAVLELIPLRGLSFDDGQKLLIGAGVAPGLAPMAVRLGRGHPLALHLLAETLAGDPGRPVPDDLDHSPDLVAALLGRLVDELPDDEHRLVIELACLSRVTTRSLLRELCDRDRADELFDWLAAQPWVDRLPGGLCPHDLARDVIAADLRNNDPDRYADAKRALRKHILDPERLRRDPERCTSDYLHLHRRGSLLRSAWDWSSFGRVDLTEVGADDRDELAQLVAGRYGPASVAVLDHWLDRQPQAFTVVRSLDEIIGVSALLVLYEVTADDLAADPSVAAVWERAQRQGRPRQGETIGVSRFVCDRYAGTMPPSPTYNVTTTICTQRWLTADGLSLDYVVKPTAGLFRPMMDYIDFHPVPDAAHLVGDTEMSVFEHNWREAPRAQWLERMEALEAGAPIVPATDTVPVLLALDQAEFADAVRAALRDLTRPGRLVSNPLVVSRVVRDQPDHDGPDALAGTLREAFAALDDHPRTERARRAVDRTYFHGAVTQEAAAEVLDMAFSTYRRHLATGVGLLVDRMWQWELYGRGN
jgi:hypothetical protein